jgi:hypothetical protein
MSNKTNRILIEEYNGNWFSNLEFCPAYKVLFYKDREIPWKSNRSVIKNKKSDELKTYEYITVVIPDVNNKKHKIFKNKFLKHIESRQERQHPFGERKGEEPTIEPVKEEEEKTEEVITPAAKKIITQTKTKKNIL